MICRGRKRSFPHLFQCGEFFFPPNMHAYTKGLSHSLVLAQQPNIRFDADPHVRTIPGPHDHLCRFLLFLPCSWRNNWSLFVAITIISIIILLEVLLLQYTTTFQVGIYMCVCVFWPKNKTRCWLQVPPRWSWLLFCPSVKYVQVVSTHLISRHHFQYPWQLFV